MGDQALRSPAGVRVAVAGFAFLAVDLVAILLGGPLPSIDDPAERLLEFYRDGSTRLLAQAYTRGLSMALLMLFVAALAGRLRRDRTSWAASLWVASAAVIAAVELARIAVVAGVALQPERVGSGTVVALHAAGLVLGAAIAFPIAAGQVAACVLLIDTQRPRWLSTVGGILAVAWLVTGVRSVWTNHALWTAGTVVTFAWGLWLLALCVDVWRITERAQDAPRA